MLSVFSCLCVSSAPYQVRRYPHRELSLPFPLPSTPLRVTARFPRARALLQPFASLLRPSPSRSPADFPLLCSSRSPSSPETVSETSSPTRSRPSSRRSPSLSSLTSTTSLVRPAATRPSSARPWTRSSATRSDLRVGPAGTLFLSLSFLFTLKRCRESSTRPSLRSSPLFTLADS